MLKNKKSIFLSTFITLICLIFVFLFGSFYFNAQTPTKKELVTIYLLAYLSDKNGEKIYLEEDDKVNITDSLNNNIEYIIDNGAIKASIPLYEKDIDNEGEITKEIIIDNSKHTTYYKEKAFFDTYNASKLINATKNGEKLEVLTDNYYIELDSKYNNNFLIWELQRELEQTYSNDVETLNIKISCNKNYKEQEKKLEFLEETKRKPLPAFVLPCDYTEYEVKSYIDGSYLKIFTNDSKVSSISDGFIIESNNIENYIKIKYSDGLIVRYDNVVPGVFNSEVKKGQTIGYLMNDYFFLYTLQNNKITASTWLFEEYERPEEGISMPRMYQTDERWSDISYGYNTIGGGGCGPSSFAMTLSGLTGEIYTPEDIVNVIKSSDRKGIWYYVKGQGSTYTIFPYLAEYYGLQFEDEIGTSEQAIRDALNEGKTVIVSISYGKYYKGDGHFITIRGLSDNGKFLINDSSTSFDINTEYEYSDIKPVHSARAFWIE